MRRMFHVVIAALASLPLAGCASIGTPELTQRVRAVPDELRDNVHVYLINSPLDQLHVGRLGDVAKYLRQAGFEHASYRHWADGRSLARDLLTLRSQQPDARIALIGWSGGSLTCWDAATILSENQQIVDCIVYLDSNWIKNRLRDRGHPDNVVRLVCIYNEVRDPPEGLTAATVYRVQTTNHLSMPAHPQTVEALVEELIATATQPRF